jgi:DNA-binding NtrC family response regulator
MTAQRTDNDAAFPKLLVVDDDESFRFFLTEALIKEGYSFETAANGEEALKRLEETSYDIVLMDIRMPKLGGLPALERMKTRFPNLLVILMTAYGSRKIAMEAITKGAYDYFTKPLDLEEFRVVIRRAAERCRLEREVRRLREEASRSVGPAGIIGDGEPMRQVLTMVERVAKTEATVLITGESGTGKELVAQAIHRRSDRASGPFVPVNCAGIPESLLEDDLFGHEKGAFTGAHQSRPGKFEQAQGGTLFLDEIGEMNLSMQTKLLRVLQEREVERLGGLRPIKVDVRVLAATNRDLAESVKAGRFREDLYFRINVIHIPLPPLRKRLEDLPALARHFVEQYAEKHQRPITGLSRGAMDRLLRHDWPGNVRELENVIQRSLLMAPGPELTEQDLQGISDTATAVGTEAEDGSLRDRVGLVSAGLEKQMITEALEAERWRRSAAARRLGISRKHLYNKMKKYGLLE